MDLISPMTLYLIGIGLADEKDISVKGLEIVRKCTKIYFENYTSLLQCSQNNLEQFYGKQIIPAGRALLEEGADHIVEEAKKEDVAVLIIGDPFSATTHSELLKSAFYAGVPVEVVHNASILTAVGQTGLQLYKFGKTTSIPFLDEQPQLETPYAIVKKNRERELHTLLLLDLRPQEKKFMTVGEALEILEHIEERKKEKIITSDLLVIGCARLGSSKALIRAGTLQDLKKVDFGKPPHCLIIPGKLHFAEEEMVGMWQKEIGLPTPTAHN